MELGKKIRQLRFKAGLTQEQLAEKLGIGAQSVSKWETGNAMPDITLLPCLSEIFGVSIDEMFDLTQEQRMNRIENRLDREEELPQDVFLEYEEFLKGLLDTEAYGKRALNLMAFLWWHRMETCAGKVRRYAGEAVRLAPDEKESQWMLQKADNHAVWDWNAANHTGAVEFYKELVRENPESRLSYYFLLDNLIADHRVKEAEEALGKLCALADTRPVLNEVYRAHIALARFDEPAADGIMEKLIETYGDDPACLFETAQYYAKKCDYGKAVAYYEQSFEKQARKPRFQDELMAIAQIHEITGSYQKAAETWGRIAALLQNEWGMTEETELVHAEREKARLLAL